MGKSDRKRKLHINPQKNKAHCFRCGFGSDNANAVCQKYGIVIDTIFAPTNTTAKKSLRLPIEYQDVFIGREGRRALKYLLDRGISVEDVVAYGIGYCEEGRYANRIILPIYEDGELSTFQARDYTGTKELRYDRASSTEGAGSNPIFNLDRIPQGGVIVVTEGVLDALRMSEFAIGILGSTWNSEKRAKILKKKPYALLMALDRDDTAEYCVRKIKEDLTGLVKVIDDLPFTSKDLGSIQTDELKRAYDICSTFDEAATVYSRRD